MLVSSRSTPTWLPWGEWRANTSSLDKHTPSSKNSGVETVETHSLTTPLHMKGLAALDDLWGRCSKSGECSFMFLPSFTIWLEIDDFRNWPAAKHHDCILDALALRILPFDCSQRRLPQLWVQRKFGAARLCDTHLPNLIHFQLTALRDWHHESHSVGSTTVAKNSKGDKTCL